ncbi:Splicing factor [Puccinia graminis f. sp. tritici]|nr:Splicing factor [Puccinia graminis f. sp. tritici]
MAEVEMENAEVPPPDTDEDSPDQILNQLLEVMSALQTNPFDYSLHERNVALCQKLGAGTIEELNQARTLMSEYFPVKEDFFTDWVSDVVSSHQSPYEVDCVQKVLEIYEQASSYSFFFKIETTRLRYMIDLFYYARGLPPPAGEVIERIAESSEIDTKDPDHVTERTEEQIALESFISEERLRTLAIDVMDKTGYHLLESSAIWNMWAIHEFDNLKRNWNTDGLAQFKNMVQARLRIPHTDSPKTFQMYSNLITKYENNNYEEEMVAVNTLYSPARKLMEDREAHEAQLKKSGYSCQEYLKYISWEISRKPSHFDLAQMLFERALADHPNSVELWLEFLRYLNHHRDQHALSAAIVKRATRTVPWSGEIWACAIRTFERNNQTIEAVEGLCARAIQSKFLEHDIEALISFTIGRADFHRRRLDAYIVAGGNENAEQVKSLIDMVANVLHHGIDTTKKVLAKTGDPSCRLEKYLATFFEHHDREDDAAKVWQKATKQYRNASSPWISAAECEARRGDLTRAREYYKKSSNIKLDYPEYLLEAWLTFEHHFGALDDLEYAISKVNNLMKGISARRKREAEQNSETLAQNSSLDNTVGDDAGGRAPAETDENSETRKRKAETIAETKGGDKKIKLNTLPTEATTSTNAGEVPELKR